MTAATTLEGPVPGQRWAANDAYSPNLLRQLADASLSRGPLWRFPAPAEGDFRRDARVQANGSRMALCLLAGMLLMLAPHAGLGWALPVSWTGPMSWALLLLWGSALALLFWRPVRVWGTVMMAVAGGLTVASLQGQPAASAAAGLVPLAALTLLLVMGRFRGGFALSLAAAYLVLGIWGAPGVRAATEVALAQSVMEWLTLAVVLLGGFWSDAAHRRTWAAQRVLRLSAANDIRTGLLNRQAFEAYYQRLAFHARRQGSGMVVALVEFDLFHAFRDREGQGAADAAVNTLGRLLRDFARRSLDVAARISDTHFALVLFDCQGAPGMLRLEHLRAAVEGLEIRHPVAPSGLLTVSIGAVHVGGETSLPWVLTAADQELQRAQRLGHNRARMRGTEPVVTDYPSSGAQAAGQG
jgi:diguanylate cyclase (GGDEF)-like protein